MALFVGSMETFDPAKQTISEWLERLDLYTALNDVDAATVPQLLLSLLGPDTYKVVRQACLPDVPRTKTLEQLRTILKDNYEPKSLIRTNRRKLAARIQKPEENVNQYANGLRSLASLCGYPAAYLEVVLVDTFCRGVKSVPLKEKLEKEENLETLAAAVHIGEQHEGVEEVRNERNPDMVCKVSNSWKRGRSSRSRGRGGSSGRGGRGANSNTDSSSHEPGRGGFQNRGASRGRGNTHGSHQQHKGPIVCFRCNKSGHLAPQCAYIDYKCRSCGKIGHLSAACMARAKYVESDQDSYKVHAENDEQVEDLSEMWKDKLYISKKVYSERSFTGSKANDLFTVSAMKGDTYLLDDDVDYYELAKEMCTEMEVECELLTNVKCNENVTCEMPDGVIFNDNVKCTVPADITYNENVKCTVPADITYNENVKCTVPADITYNENVKCTVPADVTYKENVKCTVLDSIVCNENVKCDMPVIEPSVSCNANVKVVNVPCTVDVSCNDCLTAIYEENVQCNVSVTALCDKVMKAKHVSEQMSTDKGMPLLVNVRLNSVNVIMEVDTGSRFSLVTKQFFVKRFPKVPLLATDVNISSLSGHSLCAKAQATVNVSENGQTFQVRVIVCEGNDEFTPLLGREWLDVIVPGWRKIWGLSAVKVVVETKSSEMRAEIEEMKRKYPNVFTANKGTSIEGFTASVMLKPGSRPVFHKEYTVPYSLRESVARQLREKVQEGRYVRVERSLWASPIWPIPKANSEELRLVHDYKKTVNPNIVIDHYPLPVPEDIFHALNGCKRYCVIDCAEAYMQLRLEEASQDILVLNTCLGLLKPTRLPYGLASSSACFQSVIDQILFECPKTKAYVDDVIVGGADVTECRNNLNTVLQRLNKHKVRVNIEKMKLYVKEVEFLGFVLGNGEIKPSPKTVQAIMECPQPKDVSELRAYLGMLNFYNKFLPNASTKLKPLYNLLQKGVKWKWTPECSKVFELSKQDLCNSPALSLYDPTKTLVVVSDASPVGVGAVLAMREGQNEKPIAFISQSLSTVQQGYSQLEREALGIIVALTKFHKFIWGRKFILVTDNLPLKTLFSPDKSIPKVAAQRLQRWAAILGNYNYVVEYRKSERMAAADALSRLPSKERVEEICCYADVIPELPLNWETVQMETQKDPQLKEVKLLILNGWPEKCPSVDLKCYYDVRYALSLECECVMFADKVVIPHNLQSKVLTVLHEAHPGMVRMKLRAREVLWWPEINRDIENFVSACELCAKANFNPVSCSQVPWKPTCQAWERIHVDFFFLEGKAYLLCVDSFSKWLEVWPMNKTNADSVINKLTSCFATWGLPVEIMSDNGPPFSSIEFLDFCTKNLIVASKSAPHHPQGNGLAERSVQTVKSSLKKMLTETSDLSVSLRLSNFLVAYRTTPSTVTRKSPAELMLNFAPRTLVSVLKPKPKAYVPNKRQLQTGDKVWVKLSQNHAPFLASILKVVGPTLMHVAAPNGKTIQVSVNQLKLAHPSAVSLPSPVNFPVPVDVPPVLDRVVPPLVNVPVIPAPIVPPVEDVVPVDGDVPVINVPINDNQRNDVGVGIAPQPVLLNAHRLRPRENINPPARYRD